LSALGVLLTLTRSVWIGTALGALVLVAIVPALRRRVLILAGGSVAAMVSVLALVPGLGAALIDRLMTERSVFDRQNTNAAALRVIEAHPLDGIGWMRFLPESIDWVRQADSYPVTNVDIEVHNVVLSRAAELGLVGAALWVCCVLAGPVLSVLRRPIALDLSDWRLVLLGYGCVWVSCTMVSPVPYVLPNDLLWLISGLLLRGHLVTRAPAMPHARPREKPAAAAVEPKAAVEHAPPPGRSTEPGPGAPAARSGQLLVPARHDPKVHHSFSNQGQMP
jgi:O-antigen ligase